MENLTQIALFGGSFDPVTNAHKEIVAKLSKRFDKVVVMPTGVSPFKTRSQASASGSKRVEMLKRALRGMENVTVSRFEIKRDGVSYTADTLRHLKEKYDGADIFTVIGSEELPYLDNWHEPEALKELTTFYVVERGGCPLDLNEVRNAKANGWKIAVAPFVVGDCSSGEVKIARAFEREDMPVPKSVAKYILKNNLYTDYRYITDRYSEFGLKKERIDHIERVAYAAVKLAKRYGVSGADAITAALLHDIAKESGAEELKRDGIDVPENIAQMPEKIRHAAYGALVAEHCFGITDRDILDAIRLHTTGDKGMTKLAEVVFLADCIEEGRKYETAEEIRLKTRESLESGMATALGLEIARLKSENGEIYPLTVKAYNCYKKLAKDRVSSEPAETKLTRAKKPAANKSEKSKKHPAEENPADKPSDKETKANGERTEKEIKPRKKAEPKKEKPEEAPRDIKSISSQPPEPAAPAQDSEPPQRKKDKAEKEAHKLAREIGGYLVDKRGFDVTLIDVTDRTVVTDYFVIASANSTTQVKALADYVDEKLSKERGLEPLHRDKNPQWYAVDYGSVILHIFQKSTREAYDLERLWSDGTNTEVLEK